MADVAGTIGTAEQVRLVAALRWRIFRNGWGRSHGFEVVGTILVTFVLTALVIGVGVAFGAGAHWLLSTGRYGWMAALFWAVCLFWQVFPTFVASFGATFDLRSLLRFGFSHRWPCGHAVNAGQFPVATAPPAYA